MNADSLLLDAADVRSIVNVIGRDALMDSLIGRLSEAIRRFDPAVAQVPPRGGLQYRAPDWGLLEWMPAQCGAEGTTVKLVGYHPSNPENRGLPSIISTVYLFDGRTGHLVGLVDGTFLTALRTGASSAVASRVLAEPGSRTLGVIGCGAQSVTQIHALSRLFPLERVIAFDIRDDVAQTLKERIAFLDLRVERIQAESLTERLAEVDILCTCTSAAPGEGPVFRDFANRPHLHVNAVGSDFHGKFEVPVELLRRSMVCPDFTEQAIDEGECQQLERHEIGPDLRTLVQRADEYVSARRAPTVFDSTGWALEDHVAALLMFDYAQQIGVGRRVAIECLPSDAKDPYSVLGANDTLVAAARVASSPLQ